MDTLHVRKDTLASSSYIRPILQLNDLLKSNGQNGLRWTSKYYHEENHGTVPLLAEYDALHFVFSDYKAPAFVNLRDSSFDYKDAVIRHYEKVSKQLGYTVLPLEFFVNELAYTFVGNKMFDQAKIFFEMNIKNYPKSFNVYDSMGDYYIATEDNQKAIEYFSKALSLRDNIETRQKMEKLKIEK
jgi:tetratricopeptide (TPR) repeat protein